MWRGDHDRIDAFVRARRVAALALELMREAVGRGHHRAGADGEAADRDARHVVQAVDLLHAEALDARRPPPSPAPPPPPSSAGWKITTAVPSKLRVSARYLAAPSSMAVWPSWPQACILPGAFGPVGDVGRLLDRQGVHVGAKPDHLARAVATGPWMTPTTPVRPIPVTTSSQPNALELVRDDRRPCGARRRGVRGARGNRGARR